MKKLNNKGFAISTMLYGLLVVLILVISMLMSTMAFNRKNSKEFNDKVIKDLEDVESELNKSLKEHTVSPTKDDDTSNDINDDDTSDDINEEDTTPPTECSFDIEIERDDGVAYHNSNIKFSKRSNGEAKNELSGKFIIYLPTSSNPKKVDSSEISIFIESGSSKFTDKIRDITFNNVHSSYNRVETITDGSSKNSMSYNFDVLYKNKERDCRTSIKDEGCNGLVLTEDQKYKIYVKIPKGYFVGDDKCKSMEKIVDTGRTISIVS